MESNWRFNVWDQGWSYSTLRLLARINSGTFAGKWLGATEFASLFVILQDVGPGQPPVFFGFGTPPASHPHFPYGFDVLAD